MNEQEIGTINMRKGVTPSQSITFVMDELLPRYMNHKPASMRGRMDRAFIFADLLPISKRIQMQTTN